MLASLALVARRENLSPPLTGIGLLNLVVLDFVPFRDELLLFEKLIRTTATRQDLKYMPDCLMHFGLLFRS